MSAIITGLHHVTALARKPATNAAFYTRTLGLRLVKRTVNFDDPFTYHLYYGDELGRPGTLLTHFPHPMAARADHGGSEITETTLAIPAGTLGYWIERLVTHGAPGQRSSHMGRSVLRTEDPDGMRVSLVEQPGRPAEPGAPAEPGPRGYGGNGVPEDRAVVGVAGVRITVPDAEETCAFLESALGFARRAVDSVPSTPEGGVVHRMTLGQGGPGRWLDVEHAPAVPRRAMGAGTVHHVAWRVPDEASQSAAAAAIRQAGAAVTPVMDRQYFKSIYFRIPGGVIFEIATDGPGFDADEPRESLGTALMLPPQYEPRRALIERRLESLEIP